MKIVHLCLGNFYADGYAYQENMLVKEHKKLGLDVSVIASRQTFDSNGKVVYTAPIGEYINDDGVKVIRLDYKKNNSFYFKMKRFIGTMDALEKEKPDVLFVHNVQFLDMNIVISYLKKHPGIRVYADNHADYGNSALGFVSKNILHGIIWKKRAKMIDKYATRFYGNLPVRVVFLKDIYKIKPEKCKLLFNGADGDLIEKSDAPEVKQKIRNKHNIGMDDFLICTGGKINHNRTETLDLMKAVSEINDNKVKLLIFGTVAEELKEEFNKLLENENIEFAGWKKPEETYEYMAASDLMVFPGLHSVMWEQAVAQGIPCIFRKIDGLDHIDLGGNCIRIDDVSKDNLKEIIIDLYDDIDKYHHMKAVALGKGRENFAWSEIAKVSIDY